MKPKERKAYIIEKVRQENFASVENLSKIFNVSVQSIRKDINDLCKNGLLRRIYGGVEVPTSTDNTSYENRKVMHYDAKKSIAKEVAKLIPNNSSLFFSIGTTPEIIAKELKNHQDLKVFTNNINVALVCSHNPTFEVTLHGGKIRNKHLDILESGSEEFFNSFSVDFGIFGVGAIREDGSLLDFTKEEVLARESIVKNSKEVFLVADYSKFSRKAYIRGGDLKQITHFFCDQKPIENISKLLKEYKIKSIYTKKELK
jgi:DeoR family glycerol-3-phosphate regulon repressor